MTSKGSRTRQRIVEKALQLFSVKGYYNTSVSDIQEATGLTKGGLYGHFASKEDIWYAVYDKAVEMWRGIVFKDIRSDLDSLERIETFIRNDLVDYLGGEVFDGGCFFLNMLVELTGQSAAMSRRILRGFVQMSRLLRSWLEEAEQDGRIRPGLDLKEVALPPCSSPAGTSRSCSRPRPSSAPTSTSLETRIKVSRYCPAVAASVIWAVGPMRRARASPESSDQWSRRQAEPF
jgi:TetR/AcrR family transcriptional repressor of nem operon